MNNSEIGKLYKKLKNLAADDGIDTSGGNCAVSTFAIYNFLKEKFNITLNISAITNAESEEELLKGAPDVYHVFLADIKLNYFIDEFGLKGSRAARNYLLDMAYDQYGNDSPQIYEFSMPAEENKIKDLIRQTNHSESWEYFYDLLKKN